VGRLLIRHALRRSHGLAACALLAARAASAATDWQLSADLRLVDSDGEKSFLDGGQGTLRFGEDRSGLRIGRLRFALDQSFGQILTLKLDASSWGDHDKTPVGLTEAYLLLRPYPFAGWRARLRAGAFYAPISLENRAAGWESPYTITYSALDSWVAEELRTIGLESQLEWLGTRTGKDFDVGLTAAVYGWNDPAGVGLADHGFALDDRQSLLEGRVGVRGAPPFGGYQEFHEVDTRPGEYEGLEVRYLDRIVVRALHYDNQANPAAFDALGPRYAWETYFDTAGIRAENEDGWGVIAQWLAGETYVEPFGNELEWKFRTRYVLLSKRTGRHSLSARYDDFEVDPEDGPVGWQKGHALTAAYVFEASTHWRCTLEWVRVRSFESNRALFLGQAPFATESMLQLAIRYALGAH